jgi:transposase InsO family protein
MRIATFCKKVGMTRQNYYKSRATRQRKSVDDRFIKELVQAERSIQPRLGGRKLYKILGPRLKEENIRLGRDRFYNVLKDKGLLLDKLPRSPRTTNSYHTLPVFSNLIKDMSLTKPNQVWASDITYLRTQEKFMYLSLITDMYSRKIVGYHLSDNMEAEQALNSLKMALKSKPNDAKPIHHSDRGSQYCSHLYIQELKNHGMSTSMTEDNHCAENALAERVNGILKQEYGLRCEFRNPMQAHQTVKQAVMLYNTMRPHYSLKLNTPEQVHRMAA